MSPVQRERGEKEMLAEQAQQNAEREQRSETATLAAKVAKQYTRSP